MKARFRSANGASSTSSLSLWDVLDPPAPQAVPATTCPHCFGTLELSQPDSSRGDALLGVCPKCPAWFLINGRDGTVRDLGLGKLLGSRSSRRGGC
jgi:hypothetical protein